MFAITSSTHLRRRLATALAAAGLVCAAGASPALADSVAYLKGGDIWLSTSDGARQFQVTSGGGYSSVSQADDGRLVALRGDKIRQLDRQGAVLSEIATPVSTSTDPSMSFKGPFDPAVSPDGRKVAYSYYWQYTGYDPYCNPTNNCYIKRLYHGTGFTAVDRLTAWDEPGFLRRSGWKDAHWLDNSQVLLTDPYIQPNEDTVLWSPDDKDSLKRWFQDPQYPGAVQDAVMSRDKSAMATITDDGRSMSILRSAGLFHPDYPVRCYEASLDDETAGARLSSPTFNASGTRMFWAAPDGVHAVTLPTFTTDSCGTLTDTGSVLVPGATAPAWGPADVPAPRQTPPPGGGEQKPAPAPAPAPAPPAPAPGPVVPAPAPAPEKPVAVRASVSVTGGRLAAVLRSGLDVRLSGLKAGRHTVTASVGGRRVGSGTVTVGSSGSARLRVRFTATAKKSLARKTTVKVVLKVAGASRTVTLKKR